MQLIIPKLTTPFGTVQRLVEPGSKLPAVHILRLSRCWSHVDLVSAVRLKVGVLNVEVRNLERELSSDGTKNSQCLKATGGRVRDIRDVLLHVTSGNEASFASNSVVYGLVAIDPASRQKQPSLGWRHVVDEDLLAESVHLEQEQTTPSLQLVSTGARRGVALPRRGSQALATARRAKQ